MMCVSEIEKSIDKNIGLFGNRPLYKRLYSAKETYIFKEHTSALARSRGALKNKKGEILFFNDTHVHTSIFQIQG